MPWTNAHMQTDLGHVTAANTHFERYKDRSLHQLNAALQITAPHAQISQPIQALPAVNVVQIEQQVRPADPAQVPTGAWTVEAGVQLQGYAMATDPNPFTPVAANWPPP